MKMISVVIPALNEQELIGECLRSLKNQDYSKEYEIIVMDNGSEDRTPEIAENYCDKLFIEPDLSLYELRNKGILKAEGEIVAQTDADCIASENWLKEIEKGLKNSILVTGPVLPYEDSGFYRVFLFLYNSLLRVSMNVFYFSHASAGNCAFYKEAALEVGGFKDSFPSDGKFGVDMRKVGGLFFNPDMLVFTSIRRFRNDSFSKSVWELLISHLKLRWGGEKEFEKSYYWSENE